MFFYTPPPPDFTVVRNIQALCNSDIDRGATPFLNVKPAASTANNHTIAYEPTDTGILVRNVTLDPDTVIPIQRFDPEAGGGYTVPAYQMIDQQTGVPIYHPLTRSSLYVHGGDRIGIASMNFDLVYNEHGYVVGLIDDVVCQAVIRNYHTYPPQRDCWEHTLPYQRVESVESVISYLETDFLFYTWVILKTISFVEL